MNRNFTNYTADDFIADESFQEWATNPIEANKAFWEQWIEMHPDKEEEIKQALSFIQHLKIKPVSPTTHQIERSLQNNLTAIYSLESEKTNKKAYRLYWMAAAVAILVIVTVRVLPLQQNRVTMELATGNNEIKTVVLPDQSVAVLNAKSSISYSSDLGSSAIREVWLDGEAFFDIRHIGSGEKNHPFIVHCNDLNIEVLGTTFNVRKKGLVTNVTLNSGKIRIDVNNTPGSVIMMQPGDFIQHSVKEKRITRKPVNPKLYSEWKERKMTLVNTPLVEIAEYIKDTYQYKIQITEKELSRQKISGTLVLKDEDAMLQTLSLALHIDIIKKDSILIFQSKNKKE